MNPKHWHVWCKEQKTPCPQKCHWQPFPQKRPSPQLVNSSFGNGGQETGQFSFICFLFLASTTVITLFLREIAYHARILSVLERYIKTFVVSVSCVVKWSAHRQIWQTATRHVATTTSRNSQIHNERTLEQAKVFIKRLLVFLQDDANDIPIDSLTLWFHFAVAWVLTLIHYYLNPVQSKQYLGDPNR